MPNSLSKQDLWITRLRGQIPQKNQWTKCV